MEIEGFDSIISIVTLAKELHDLGRFDIVREQFFDTLCWDSYYENTIAVIASVFSGFHINYDDENEEECMIFTDDVISEYYRMAWEYGRSHKVRHDENPFVIEAENEVSRWLSLCHSMGWKLLGYTRTIKTAGQSKLIVYISQCTCDSHGHLAYSLVQLYQWFTAKCADFREKIEAVAINPALALKDVMAS